MKARLLHCAFAMLLMIFVGSVIAAIAVVAYSYQVLFGKWGRGSKRGVVYAPPPMPPPPPNVSAMLAAVSLPSIGEMKAPRTVPMGSGPNPTVKEEVRASAPLASTDSLRSSIPERFFPPLEKKHLGPPSPPPRRQARGSMPPPLPPRPSRQRAAVSGEINDDATNVELTPPELHS